MENVSRKMGVTHIFPVICFLSAIYGRMCFHEAAALDAPHEVTQPGRVGLVVRLGGWRWEALLVRGEPVAPLALPAVVDLKELEAELIAERRAGEPA